MDKRTPMAIDTGLGFSIPGGYSPIVHDKTGRVMQRLRARQPLFNETYQTAVPPHGYTEKLTEATGPLDLSGTTTAGKMETMIHDIAFREALRNAKKLIDHPDFHPLMKKYWGAEYADLFRGWLEHIANVQNRDDGFSQAAAKTIRFFRTNVASSLTWMNPKTIVKHGLTATLMSIQRMAVRDIGTYGTKFIDPRKMWKGVAEMMVRKAPIDADALNAIQMMINPTEVGDNIRQFVLDSSAFMRTRNQRVDDTIHGAYARASERGVLQSLSQIRDQTMTLGRVPLATVEAVSTFATWYSTYKKAMMMPDATHEDAVFAADKETGRAHGSHFPGDVPRVMMLPNTALGELGKTFVMFYNFYNHFQNNVIQTAWDIRSRFPDRQTEAHATIASISGRLATIALVALVEEMTTGWASKKHEGLIQQSIEAVLGIALGGYVGARDLLGLMKQGYSPQVGGIGTVGRSIWDEKDDVRRYFQGKWSKNWLPHLASLAGVFTGGPGQAAVQMGQFGTGLITGSEHIRGGISDVEDLEQAGGDVVRGIFTGHSRPKEERPR